MSNPVGGKAPPVKLKLKTSSSHLASTGGIANSITAAPTVATPSAMSPPSATPKTAKIVLKRSLPPTPAGEGVPILPAPPGTSRVPLPSGTTKKRKPLGDNEGSQTKRVKIVAPTPKGRNLSVVVRPSHHAKIPTRPRGSGYDSEDEDREIDPVIEEQFILRMLPGEHCDALRKMVDDRKIGADGHFRLKWLKNAERRAVIIMTGAVFAAVLVDLPTISEGMKSWDRKTFVKSADICQMLLVFARVAKEEEAVTVPLPKMVGADFRWPHGLTPPMHDCIHRRFRKRLSKKEIKDKEAELQRILRADKEAMETSWELIDDARDGMRKDNAADTESYEGDVGDDEQDAIGEQDDYFGSGANDTFEIDEDELEAQFMEAVEANADIEMAETPASQPVTTPAPAETATPAAEGDEEDESEEDDEDEDMDEEAQAQAAHDKGVLEDIAALEKQRDTAIAQMGNLKSSHLRQRAQARIKQIEEEIRLKKASIGITED